MPEEDWSEMNYRMEQIDGEQLIAVRRRGEEEPFKYLSREEFRRIFARTFGYAESPVIPTLTKAQLD